MQVDVNCNFLYRERFWFGAGYRTGESVVGMMEYQVTPRLRIGYAYDMNTSALRGHTGGSRSDARARPGPGCRADPRPPDTSDMKAKRTPFLLAACVALLGSCAMHHSVVGDKAFDRMAYAEAAGGTTRQSSNVVPMIARRPFVPRRHITFRTNTPGPGNCWPMPPR